jgi:hypothetical protein
MFGQQQTMGQQQMSSSSSQRMGQGSGLQRAQTQVIVTTKASEGPMPPPGTTGQVCLTVLWPTTQCPLTLFVCRSSPGLRGPQRSSRLSVVSRRLLATVPHLEGAAGGARLRSSARKARRRRATNVPRPTNVVGQRSLRYGGC